MAGGVFYARVVVPSIQRPSISRMRRVAGTPSSWGKIWLVTRSMAPRWPREIDAAGRAPDRRAGRERRAKPTSAGTFFRRWASHGRNSFSRARTSSGRWRRNQREKRSAESWVNSSTAPRRDERALRKGARDRWRGPDGPVGDRSYFRTLGRRPSCRRR